MLRFVAFIICMGLCTPSWAQEIVRNISVVGEAKEFVLPDQASLTVEVYAKNLSLDSAKKEHDAKLSALLDVAKRYKISGKDLSTQSARISPEYRWVNNTQNFEGYTYSTQISLTLHDLSKVGALLEDVVAMKPQSINGPNYSVEETKPILDKVRVAAVADAKQKAQGLAQQLGLKVGKAISISDSSSQPPVIMQRNMAFDQAEGMMMKSATVSPPVGEEVVNAQVYIMFELVE